MKPWLGRQEPYLSPPPTVSDPSQIRLRTSVHPERSMGAGRVTRSECGLGHGPYVVLRGHPYAEALL